MRPNIFSMEELLLEDLPSINFESELALGPNNTEQPDFLETVDLEHLFSFADTSSLVGQLPVPPLSRLPAVSLECDKFIKEDPVIQPHQPTALPDPDLSLLSPQELHDTIARRYVEVSPSPLEPHRGLFLRWREAPPDRVHATSPSKLGEGRRPGGTFHFSVELVAVRENQTFGPFVATEDLVLQARIYGKKKAKSTHSPRSEDEVICVDEMKHLELNPIGKPLLVMESDPTNSSVRVHLKKGESVANFSGVSLTCGSNAARSQNAPASARVWDWEYYLDISFTESESEISTKSVIPKHITTDSNRSQTREKRKRPVELQQDTPSAKRPSQFPVIAPYGSYQPLAAHTPTSFTPFYPVLASFPHCSKLAM